MEGAVADARLTGYAMGCHFPFFSPLVTLSVYSAAQMKENALYTDGVRL